jgi:hypothetical protein
MKSLKLFVAVVAVSMVAAVSYAAGAKKSSVNWAAGDIKWDPYAPGVPLQVASLWGDRTKGESGILLKMPGGFESGMHAHTGDYHAVLVSGTWIHTEEGSTETKELTPGSYVMQVGKKMHNDACKAGADCVLLIHQKVKGDFIPGKALAKDAK